MNPLRRRAGSLLLLFLLVGAGLSPADVIVLNNGVRLRCRILAEEEDGIRYSMGGVAFKVYREGVASVLREEEESSDSSFGAVATQATPAPAPGPVRVVRRPTPTLIPTPDPLLSRTVVSEGTDVVSTGAPIPDDGYVLTMTPEPTVSDVPPFPFPGREPPIPLAIPSGEFRTVKGRQIRLRQGPSTNYPKIGNLEEGEIVVQLEEEEGWFHVRTIGGQEGWIFGIWTEPVTSSVVLVNGVDVHLRREYGLQGSVIRSMEQGEVLLMLARKGEWARVRDLRGAFGWVSHHFLDPVDDLRMVQNPVSLLDGRAADQILRQAMSWEWIPAGEGAVRLHITVHNDNLIRGGQIVLMGLRDFPRPADQAPTTLFRSPDVIWQERFVSPLKMQELGLHTAIIETTVEAVVVYLGGAKADLEWTFSVDVDQTELAYSHLAVIIQKGPRRGAAAVFAEGLPN